MSKEKEVLQGAPAARQGKRNALVRSIKRDVANGHTVTLVALSAAAIEDYARLFTEDELRLIRFSIPGLCMAAKAKRP